MDRSALGSSQHGDRPELDGPRRGWWVAAGVAQTLLTLALVVGLGWWWMDPGAVSPGQVPWPAVLIGGAALVMFFLARAVRASGRAAGRRRVLDRRAELAAAVSIGLEERIGSRVRALLDALGEVERAVRAARRAL